MSLRTLLFVSESLLRLPDDSARLQALVEASRANNAALGLTGAMIQARGHFAEVLEGPADGVAAMMDRIDRDPRHCRMRIVLDRDIAQRQFAASPMSLVYCGNSFYVDRHIAPLLAEEESPVDRAALAAQLHFLIQELAQANLR